MIADGAKGRFCPIPLASLTAFSGSAPLAPERAPQEQFLVPSASALVVGIMTATGTAILRARTPPLLSQWGSIY